MTKEDKKLLFRYLSMALPYGVVVEIQMINAPREKYPLIHVLESYLLHEFMETIENVWIHKPYLRPLASMTEEERTEINALIKQNSPSPYGKINLQGMDNLLYSVVVSSGFLMDWMLNKHFDIFDLIPKGLAIAVTEKNNPYNTKKE